MSLRLGLLLGPHPNEPLELALLRAGHRIEWRAQSADEAIGLIADRARRCPRYDRPRRPNAPVPDNKPLNNFILVGVPINMVSQFYMVSLQS